MTLVVGIELPNGGVMMGADSFVGADGDNCNADIRKVRRRSGLLIGISGGIASQDFFKYIFRAPKFEGDNPHRWMVEVFGEEVRRQLRESTISSGAIDGDVLVGVAGKIFALEGRLGTHGFRDGFGVIGSGGAWAQGSLEMTAGLNPRTRIRKALETAAKYSGSIRPPWHIASIKCQAGSTVGPKF